MKLFSDALRTHFEQEVTTLATGWRLERPLDGMTFGRVDHDTDIVIDGVTYLSALGLQPTSAHSTQDLSVDTLDVSIFLDVVTEQEIAAGVWDNAIVTVFEYDWSNPPALLDDTVHVLRYGTIGQLTRADGVLKAEIRGLTQRLNRRIGRIYSPTCPWRHALWDVATQNYISSPECNVDLGPFIWTGTVTALGPDPTRTFDDSALAAPSGTLDVGLITFTTGPNHNITREIQRWDNQRFELDRPLPFAASLTESFSAVEGDDQTWETCRLRFFNGRRFGGMPYTPGQHAVQSLPAGLR